MAGLGYSNYQRALEQEVSQVKVRLQHSPECKRTQCGGRFCTGLVGFPCGCRILWFAQRAGGGDGLSQAGLQNSPDRNPLDTGAGKMKGGARP